MKLKYIQLLPLSLNMPTEHIEMIWLYIRLARQKQKMIWDFIRKNLKDEKGLITIINYPNASVKAGYESFLVSLFT